VTLTGGVQAVVAVAIWYALGLARMWNRAGVGRLVSKTRVALFAAGLAATALALGPPLDTHVGTNFTLHMTQHVVLIWVAAPLLVAGAPVPPLLWGLPDSWRVKVQRRWQRIHRSVAGDAWPLWVAFAVLAQALALAIWHLAPMYQAALGSDLVHTAEHASFLFTAIALWWTIAGAVRRLRFGAGVLAIFVAKLPGLLLGVGLTLDTHIWYRRYGSGAAALRDQQYAGVVMWVGGGMAATVAALILFGLWMQAMERDAPNPLLTRVPEPAQ
jgi:putative membrane protein